MSDTVMIVLIIAIAIIIVLIIFRRQLSKFVFKANKEGIETSLQTHKPISESSQVGDKASKANREGISISKNRLIGKKNVIEVGRDDVAVEDNLILGEEQKIIAKSNPKQ